MPNSIKFDNPPAGYALKSAEAGEENVPVVYREFLSSEDGMKFIQLLEGFGTRALEMIETERKVKCSEVDHLLVHFDDKGIGKLYVNELSIVGTAKFKGGAKEKGDPIYIDEIVDYEEVRFENIEIPKEHGVLIVFSSGWRKGLYFDFGPVQASKEPRTYNLWSQLGSLYSYVVFQEFYSLSEEAWNALFQTGWFPFVGLKTKTVKNLSTSLLEQRGDSRLLSAIETDFYARLPHLIRAFNESKIFLRHKKLLNAAAERFENKDWISCNSILYPRIEGVLRDISESLNKGSYRQSYLASGPKELLPPRQRDTSRIMPHRFNDYLVSVRPETAVSCGQPQRRGAGGAGRSSA